MVVPMQCKTVFTRFWPGDAFLFELENLQQEILSPVICFSPRKERMHGLWHNLSHLSEVWCSRFLSPSK